MVEADSYQVTEVRKIAVQSTAALSQTDAATYDSISKAPTYNEDNKTESNTEAGKMSFAQLLAKKLGLQNVTEDDAHDDFMNIFTDNDHAQVEARTELFERLSADITCELGKVGRLNG